ncbi:MAG: adenosine kinase [Robiginitomaculum sp.]|nr:MAG: adenosine kinase [Robiginitomaculum sp.]
MRAKYDVLGIGNAMMDVIAPISDDVLTTLKITKGSMTLIEESRAIDIHSAFKSHSKNISETAGGSGANTMAGIAGLGVSAAYFGKVADDKLGTRFTKSMTDIGVAFPNSPLKNSSATARCLIAVTPDAERSMSTFLGANTSFGPKDIDAKIVQDSAITYMEGYLFDTPDQKAAFVKASEIAKAAGRKVALTLSDSFCVGAHRAAFQHLVDNHVDILFANHDELLSLYELEDFGQSLRRVWKTGTIACVTRSEKGSVIIEDGKVHEIAAIPVANIIDTTGAGDQYAAGVLAGRAMGLSWSDAGRLGSIAAAEVISHFGARPETPIHTLAGGLALAEGLVKSL